MSEEARRYGPHFVGPFARAIDLGERKSPSSASEFPKTLVELLSDARTLHGKWRVLARRGWAGEKSDFFSILLERSDEDEVGDTREESRRRQRHHPSQDHVTHGCPPNTVPAFEQADSDNG